MRTTVNQNNHVERFVARGDQVVGCGCSVHAGAYVFDVHEAGPFTRIVAQLCESHFAEVGRAELVEPPPSRLVPRVH